MPDPAVGAAAGVQPCAPRTKEPTLSQQYPPPTGPFHGAYPGTPGPGSPALGHPGPQSPYAAPYAGTYAGPPAYLGMPAPAPQAHGLNPWVAGLIGAGVGAVLTVIAMTVLPMLLFGFAFGAMGGEDGFLGGPPSGRVAVQPDGTVSGESLAAALEDSDGDFFYEDVTCPATPKVATDETTICEGNDGFTDMRIVVVFDGSNGKFSTADLW